MIPLSVILIVSGIVCLFLSIFLVAKLRPREDRPPSPWMRTEFRATSLALGTFILFIAGSALVMKGFFV